MNPSGHLWATADLQGKDTFLHCDADSVVQLPSCLVRNHPVNVLKYYGFVVSSLISFICVSLGWKWTTEGASFSALQLLFPAC